jgi:hypothetical protein
VGRATHGWRPPAAPAVGIHADQGPRPTQIRATSSTSSRLAWSTPCPNRHCGQSPTAPQPQAQLVAHRWPPGCLARVPTGGSSDEHRPHAQGSGDDA